MDKIDRATVSSVVVAAIDAVCWLAV